MPFPPTFDRAWDETFPADTQLANLLGQDIRNFKTDIRERLALLSGTLANRPTNMDAVFGGASNGILYFATDTNQVFQWSGAAWVDVTSNISGGRISNTTPIVTNANNADGIQVVIPAATLQVGATIRIIAEATIGDGAGNSNNTVSLFFGATQIVPVTIASINGFRVFWKVDLVVSAAAAQVGDYLLNRLDSAGGVLTNNISMNTAPAAEAIANAITVKTRQVATGGVFSVTHNYIAVTWK